ncbi:glycosyltransferase family 2 protein [Parvularcula sp. ZS-1/3]|uniref:Glycosyltransferase family 2 protein n=1 Tax=Parvularcula mediterranea TaxID=2732508 RepID=A0A7Y3RNR6_9PROT|nr:glycosyltransferase family 2 protein [Parvularcula mediterranea]NNU16946.1 glycosyltransferase family 2 protein [Parvularcula mediterranea]
MISVIIVSYQTGPILDEAVASALAQPEVGEVILVDNGNPEDVTDALADRAEVEDRLKLVTGHGNIGFARACNLGADEATGEHLLFLNPDAILPTGGAATLRAEGEASGSEHWATGPQLLDPDGTEQRGSRRRILTPGSAFVEATRIYKLAPKRFEKARFNAHDHPALTKTTAVSCLSGACFLVPRRTWEALGGMDRRYFLHVEDVDFFLRLIKLGGTTYQVPSVGVVHYKSSSDVDPLFVERRKKQSMNLYFATHFKGHYPPGFLTLLRGMLWVSFAFRSLKFRLKPGRS